MLARTKERKGTFSSDEYVQRLHALAITTGVEKFGGPVVIQASVPGRGEGSSGGLVRFNPLRDNPRASLLLANDRVYLTLGIVVRRGPLPWLGDGLRCPHTGAGRRLQCVA